MLGIEHDFVDPLFRPPLSLAIIAAAMKYVTTLIVLEDPILLTRSALLKRRNDNSEASEKRTQVLLGARLLFCFLAFYTFICDCLTVIHGFPHVKGWQRCHLFAMVLAFSPNTVSAVAAAFVTEVKLTWYNDLVLREDSIGWVCDGVGVMYANGMGLMYIMPSLLVMVLYGITGCAALVYCFLRDFVTLPWRLHDHHLSAVWIALPIFGALVMRTVVNLGLILGQEWYVKWKYPELASRISATDRVDMLRVKMPDQVSARVIGMARNLALATPDPLRRVMGEDDPGQEELELSNTEEPLFNACDSQRTAGLEIEDHAPAARGAHFVITARDLLPNIGMSGGDEDLEKCILNDRMLAWICYVKTSVCVSVPILQLAVIIAARVYLGNAMWQAGIETFKERSWSHYWGHVWSEGTRGWIRLVWTYL